MVAGEGSGAVFSDWFEEDVAGAVDEVGGFVGGG